MLHFDYLGCLNYKKKIYPYAWTLEWGAGGLGPSLDFENFGKNDCFLSFEWED